MRFSNRLFLGESIKDDPSRIIRKLKKKRFMSGVYLICPASNGVDPLEFYETKQLAQPFFRDKEPDIIGIATSEKEAIDIVKEIYEASVEYGHESISSYIEELFS